MYAVYVWVCMICNINDMRCCVLIFTSVYTLENTSVICSICIGQTPWMDVLPPPPHQASTLNTFLYTTISKSHIFHYSKIWSFFSLKSRWELYFWILIQDEHLFTVHVPRCDMSCNIMYTMLIILFYSACPPVRHVLLHYVHNVNNSFLQCLPPPLLRHVLF